MSEETKLEEIRRELQLLREEQHRPNGDKEQPQANGQKKEEGPKKEDQKKEDQQDQPKESVWVRSRRWVAQHPAKALLAAVILIALIIGSVVLWMYLDSYESTDDAQVDGHLNAISARIGGTVVAAYIENNQMVQAGQSLVDLDPRDYQVSLAQAKGGYAQAGAQLSAENPQVPIVQTTSETTISTGEGDIIVAQKAVAAAEQDHEAKSASLREAQAQNAKAQTDVLRFEPLVQKEEISRQQFDAVVATAKSTAASVDAAKAQVEVALRVLDQRRAQLQQTMTRLEEARRNAPRQVAASRSTLEARRAAVVSAKAQVDQASLNLAYTRIVAPVGGIVSNKTVEVGQRVQPGEDLLAISQIDDIWITANFKETQLKRMHAGQSVDVKVDAFGQTFHGYIESMPGATGTRLSLLPPQNATGNYVKVVQRLPVRIRLKPEEDHDHRLRIGMSVVPKVWLQ